MRHPHGRIKQSGDIHPPELDDGIDDFDEPEEGAAPRASVAPTRMRREPSLMPLVALLGGMFLLYRLVR